MSISASAASDRHAARPWRALLAPEMARWGGVQTYMWLLWDMLDSLSARGGVPARGFSLNDDSTALRAWRGGSEARLTGFGSLRLPLILRLFTLRPVGGTLIVGHVHQAPLALLRKQFDRRLRYVVVLHGIEAWQRCSLLERLAMAHADRVVATTAFTRDACLAENGLDAANFRVIPLCVPDAPAPAASALDGGLPLLYVARMQSTERRKGLDELLAAVAAVREQGHDVKLHVVGDGDDRPRQEALAASLGLDAAGVCFHGQLSQEALAACYPSARLFAMPSAKEGFGLVFLEAMRHGVPCIGGRHGGTPEVFRDGVEGMLVDHGDATQLADAIASFCRDPQKLASHSDAARRRFETDYLFSTFVARWRDLLNEIECDV